MASPVCHSCGVPPDAGFFDASAIHDAPLPGQEVVLAQYRLHRNHCGLLLYFSQFTNAYASDPTQVTTPGFEWQIRCDGRPREPYLTFDRIINPWGLSGFPIGLRLEEGSLLELAVRGVGPGGAIARVGGRLLGRYWYNTEHGGAPHRV
jgi:hypothetical protein